jgi:LysM repeat protein
VAADAVAADAVAADAVAADAVAATGVGGPVTGGADWYTVAPGDTVISIALRHGVDWETLLALNGLQDDTLLQLGQRLRLR